MQEKEKLRKNLEAEYRQLISEVNAICKSFDAQLADLARERIFAEQQVYMRELMIVRLGNSMMRLSRINETKIHLEKVDC